ncbi:MAG: DUF2726 domain-containing protein, partial [Psychrosphaera sp.]|nr:DUF2726 domain-containing protein [Psychrosphaera sp.]
KEYADVLRAFMNKVKRQGDYPSEDLMATLLDEILVRDLYQSFAYKRNYTLGYLVRDISQLTTRQQQFAGNPNSHIDFLLFNKLDKQPVLAIEVDGYKYHQLDEKQKERDQQKDAILKQINLPLVRFSTVGSGERETLEAALQNIMGKLPEEGWQFD